MKVVLIGLDAATPDLVERFMGEGSMPNLQGLAERGIYADNCLCPFPTITPPNWTTIMTGAMPGTHGITDFFVHLPGEPLDLIHPGLESQLRQAETIYEALERAGGSSILLNYPCTWPPTVPNTLQVAGDFLEVASPPLYLPAVFTNGEAWSQKTFTLFIQPQPIAFRPAREWDHPPASVSALMEAEMVLDNDPARSFMSAVPILAPLGSGLMTSRRAYYLLAYDPDGHGYQRLLVAPERDGKAAIADLAAGEWSSLIRERFPGPEGEAEGEFELSLLRMAPDLSDVAIALPGVSYLKFPAYPAGLDDELIERFGIPPHLLGPSVVGEDAFRHQASRQHRWLSDVARYLMPRAEWDLFMMHAHAIDFVQHDALKMADPATEPDPVLRRRYLDSLRFVYADLDLMIGEIVEAAGEEAAIIVVSDHGATAQPYPHNLGRIFGINGGLLEDAGLTVYDSPPEDPLRKVDWNHTRAIFQRTCHVYVNLKGRDPQGIVEPGREYEALRNYIIDLLLSYNDPVTGERPVSLALRREDARLLGLYGERVGDVIYATGDAFGGFEHGFQLPTSRYGISSLRSLLVMSGPGIIRSLRLNRTIGLEDIAPTAAHLLGIPPPAQCEGGIIYQALE
jgi:predicted AlkP superfamily phosphohydrolase/phosphomutase